MKSIFFVLLILSILNTNGQVTFQKSINLDDGQDIGWSVIIEPDGYIIGGGGFAQSIGDWASIKLFKTDLEGNLLWTKLHGKFFYAYFSGKSGSMIDDTGGGYTLGGRFQNSNGSIADAHLLRFDENGDTLWRRTYGGTNFDEIRQARQTSDRGYIMIGETSSLGDIDGDFYLVKTDSLGNLEWQRKYGGQKRDRGLSIEITQDNGYILSGTNLSYGPGDGGAYVIKTDSQGNVQWDSTYGTQGLDFAGIVTTSRDGGYFLWGGLDTVITIGDEPLVEFVYKLDKNGNIVWRTFFNSPQNSTIWQLRELVNGDIVFIGEKVKPSINDDAGWIVKLDKNGNKVWERLYSYELDTIDHLKKVAFMGDFQQTPDGGFIVTGLDWKEEGNTQVFKQEIFLMKLDSMGCLIPGCDTITGIQELPAQRAEINILPNPFSQSATIAIRLQENSYHSRLTFNLYNLSGQLMQSNEVNTNQYGYTEFQLRRNGMPSGIYFYELTSTEDFLARGKIVINK